MSRVDDLKAEFEIAVVVAELEDKLETLKAGGAIDGDEDLATVKAQLREWRCVLRLGRPAKDGSHRGFNIINGHLVEKGE